MFLPAFLILLLAAPDSTAFIRSGLQALQQGQLDKARTDLESALKSDPHNAIVLASLAQVYLRLHDASKAEQAASSAERYAAAQPAILHALALYNAESGKPLHAGELEEQYALASGSDPAAFDRAGRYFLAARDRARAFAAASKNPAVAFGWSQSLLKQGDYTGAADLLSQALDKNQNDVQLTLALGVARYGQRRFEDAISEFMHVMQLDPEIPQPYVFIAKMLDQVGGRLPGLVDRYRSYADRHATDAEAQLLLAKVLLAADPRDPKAEQLLRKSISLDNSLWEAHYQLGVLLESARKFQDAAPELSKAAELAPKEAMPHYHLARVYDRLGKPDQAAAERAAHAALTSKEKDPAAPR